MELTAQHRSILEKFGLPTDFDNLSDDQYDDINDKMSDEMQLHGINEAGDGLNDYGEMCVDIITSLPDE